MGAIFGKRGGSKQTSTNVNRDMINSSFGGAMGGTGEAMGGMSALLGGDASGFNAYKDATGFNAMVQEGTKGIMGTGASRGLLRSGASGKALANYGNMMGNQYAQNYMQNLMGQGQLGIGAGGLVAQAGQQSDQTSKPGKKGLLDYAMPAASMIAASDRRLKENVETIGTKGDLPLYTYNYIGDDKIRVGVMADEVEQKYPEALGPLIEGRYKTVDYGKLEQVIGA